MMRRTLIIAEAGVNHDGSLEDALAMVDVAADAGADVVKFQTFDADALAASDAPLADYQRLGSAAPSQQEMLRALQLDRAAHDALATRCASRDIELLSTAFDLTSLGWLLELGVRRIKVPSGELTNGPFLLELSRTGLPLLVSTGMASLADVELALAVLAFGMSGAPGIPSEQDLRAAYRAAIHSGALRERVTLLHCTSSYPARPDEVDLAAMDTLATAFGVPVGYSDHTLGIAVGIAAVARGACVLEKHFTLGRDRSGPDHAASLEPGELAELVAAVRVVEEAIGSPVKLPSADEEATARVARRSVVAARDLAAGEVLDAASLTTLRPGTGRPPADLWRLVGRRAGRAYARGEQLDDLAP